MDSMTEEDWDRFYFDCIAVTIPSPRAIWSKWTNSSRIQIALIRRKCGRPGTNAVFLKFIGLAHFCTKDFRKAAPQCPRHHASTRQPVARSAPLMPCRVAHARPVQGSGELL